MSKKDKEEMTTLTVSIPDDLKKRMDAMPEINWTAYLRDRLILRIKQLKKFQEMVRAGEIKV
jgi:predicted transcriptional regulator